MDPAMEPINGIDLERYADLAAAIEGKEQDKAEVARIMGEEGVQVADWEAAVTGWTARMQDMSLMGRVATAYMPLYQAALARRKGGNASLSYEDFAAVSAAIKVFGFEGAIHACGISQSEWGQAASDWTTRMGQEMGKYAGHHAHVDQLAAQLQAGGQPKKVQVTMSQNSAAAAAGAAGAGANPYAAAMGAQGNVGGPAAHQDPMGAAMAAAMANPAMQQAQAQQAAVMANPIGHGLGLAGKALTGGIVPGSRVMVAWSDGNKYPGKVMNASPGQYQVQFDNGSQQWIPENAVTKA